MWANRILVLDLRGFLRFWGQDAWRLVAAGGGLWQPSPAVWANMLGGLRQLVLALGNGVLPLGPMLVGLLRRVATCSSPRKRSPALYNIFIQE